MAVHATNRHFQSAANQKKEYQIKIKINHYRRNGLARSWLTASSVPTNSLLSGVRAYVGFWAVLGFQNLAMMIYLPDRLPEIIEADSDMGIELMRAFFNFYLSSA